MDSVSLLGFSGAVLTTVALVPQVLRSLRTKKTRDISLGWILSLTGGFSCWLVYGWLIDDAPLILANAASLLLIISLFWMKLKWGMSKAQ
jgi:MtN3 and saliva related transmembrane protein